jgi:homoprotocatechuate degradation regulator HpaR
VNPRRRNLPLALLHAREAAMGHFRPILKAHGLTDQQWRVVRVLSETEQPLESGRVAEACQLLAPSLTGILKRLVETGLVERAWSRADQRRQLVTLTPKGRALVDRMTPLIDRQYRLIEDALGKDRLDAVYDTLDRLIALLKREMPATAGRAAALRVNRTAARRPSGRSRPRRARRARRPGQRSS